MLKIEISTQQTNPCHSLFSSGIIGGLHRESFAVRGHLWSKLGIISGLGMICGRGSFAALYISRCYQLVKNMSKNIKETVWVARSTVIHPKE